ncbi:unnamed protein product [Closterium sp. Naga37s-1]|nr:unnamed protein product [Closterium sp. Naga37s-1]
MLRRFRFGRLGSLPIQPHAALSRLFQLRNAPLTSLRALPREPPRACPYDARPRHFTVVAGRRNHGGGAMKQRPKDWRPQSTPFHARNRSPRRNDRAVPLGPRGGNGGDGGDGSAESAGRMQRDVADLGADWRLGPGEAVGRVMSAQANFVRVIVTRCGVEGGGEVIEERGEESDRGSNGQSPQGGGGAASRGAAEQQGGEQRRQGEGTERREGREEEREGVELLCVVRALLKKLRRRVLVGDVVRLGGIDWAARQAVVQDVALPRASEILDPPVANADHLLLLFSLAQPPPEPSNVSRFLVAAEATGVAVSLVFNKADLVDEEVRLDGCYFLSSSFASFLFSLNPKPPPFYPPSHQAVREWQQRAAEWTYQMLTCRAYMPCLHAVLTCRAYMPCLRPVVREWQQQAAEWGYRMPTCGSAGVAAAGFMEVREWQQRAAEWGYQMLTCSVERRIGIRHLAGPGGLLAGRTTVIAGPSGVGNLLSAHPSLSRILFSRPSFSFLLFPLSHPSRSPVLLPSLHPSPPLPLPPCLQTCPLKFALFFNNTDSFPSSCLPHLLRIQWFPPSPLPPFPFRPLCPFELRLILPTTQIRSRLAASPTSCAFADCRHISEPGCAVDSGWERYRHYVMLMDEIRAREAAEIRAVGTKREGDVRLKSGGYGVVVAEPRLEAKKHRRESRKKGKQLLLQQLAVEEEEDEEEEGVGFAGGYEGVVKRR